MARGSTTVRRRHTERLRKPGAVCGICGKTIDLTREYPDPWSFCVHHPVPIARGGVDDPSNTVAAHKLCNEIEGTEQTSRVLRRSGTLNTPSN